MPDPFVFKKVLYLVEATGRSARTLEELLRNVLIVPPTCVGYHLHRGYLATPAVLPDYANDFASWAAHVLGDHRLAERVANLRVFKHRTLETLQAELGRLLAEELVAFPSATALVAPEERAFCFATARSVVMDCHRQAVDLVELRRILADIEVSSLYFHLFETRFAGGAGRESDFAEWIRAILGDQELAARVASLDPYMFSLDHARRALVGILAAPGGGGRVARG